MANVQVSCPKGHLYDPSVFSACPFCLPSGGVLPTTPLNSPQAGGVPPTTPINPPQVGMTPTMMVCPNGHQYDSSVYSSCPICSPNKQRPQQNPTVVHNSLIIQTAQSQSASLQPAPQPQPPTPQPRVRPVVGWLVCVEGKDIGKDFRLHAQFNYVGRNENQDISLSDEYVSREKHLTVSYDMLNHRYFAEKGGSSFVYINNQPLVSITQLKRGDQIRIGNSLLVFIPLEQQDVKWNWKI